MPRRRAGPVPVEGGSNGFRHVGLDRRGAFRRRGHLCELRRAPGTGRTRRPGAASAMETVLHARRCDAGVAGPDRLRAWRGGMVDPARLALARRGRPTARRLALYAASDHANQQGIERAVADGGRSLEPRTARALGPPASRPHRARGPGDGALPRGVDVLGLERILIQAMCKGPSLRSSAEIAPRAMTAFL